MIVTFLGSGTSQGVPVIGCDCSICTSIDFRDKRLRSSIHISIKGKSFIIDTGPDFRQQVLRERITSLDAVIFTHQHKDHTAGMDDIRGFNFKQERDMPIYASQYVLDQLKREFAYIFEEAQYPGVPRVETNTIQNQPFEVAGIEFKPVEVLHYKLPVFGFRVDDFTYITDAKSITDEEKEKIEGSKVLILNALRKNEHISHFTLEEAIALAEELKPGRTYFTHISHQLGLHQEVEESLPKNIFLAYDGLKIEVN